MPRRRRGEAPIAHALRSRQRISGTRRSEQRSQTTPPHARQWNLASRAAAERVVSAQSNGSAQHAQCVTSRPAARARGGGVRRTAARTVALVGGGLSQVRVGDRIERAHAFSTRWSSSIVGDAAISPSVPRASALPLSASGAPVPCARERSRVPTARAEILTQVDQLADMQEPWMRARRTRGGTCGAAPAAGCGRRGCAPRDERRRLVRSDVSGRGCGVRDRRRGRVRSRAFARVVAAAHPAAKRPPSADECSLAMRVACSAVRRPPPDATGAAATAAAATTLPPASPSPSGGGGGDEREAVGSARPSRRGRRRPRASAAPHSVPARFLSASTSAA